MPSNRNLYLVVEPMRPIAEDLAFTLQDHDPGASVLIAATPEEAMQIIAAGAAVRLAIVHVPVWPYAGSPLERSLTEGGAVSVLIGEKAEDRAAETGFPVLERPYLPEAVATLLARFAGSPGLMPGE